MNETYDEVSELDIARNELLLTAVTRPCEEKKIVSTRNNNATDNFYSANDFDDNIQNKCTTHPIDFLYDSISTAKEVGHIFSGDTSAPTSFSENFTRKELPKETSTVAVDDIILEESDALQNTEEDITVLQPHLFVPQSNQNRKIVSRVSSTIPANEDMTDDDEISHNYFQTELIGDDIDAEEDLPSDDLNLVKNEEDAPEVTNDKSESTSVSNVVRSKGLRIEIEAENFLSKSYVNGGIGINTNHDHHKAETSKTSPSNPEVSDLCEYDNINPNTGKSKDISSLENRDDRYAIDLSTLFPSSRIKRLFRCAWGDGTGAQLEENNTHDDSSTTISGVASSALSTFNNCPVISADALALISHATALMADDFTRKSAEQTLKRSKKTVSYDDVAIVVNTLDRLAFLQDVIPPLNPAMLHNFNISICSDLNKNNNTSLTLTSTSQNLEIIKSASGLPKPQLNNKITKSNTNTENSKKNVSAKTKTVASSNGFPPLQAAEGTTPHQVRDIASFFKRKTITKKDELPTQLDK